MNKNINIRGVLSEIRILKLLWISINGIKNRILLRFRPEAIANVAYRKVFNRNINLDNPKDLIEKIQWLQLYSDTSLWTLCADKYLVRDFVKEKGCEYVLNDLYGVWYKSKDINWSILPESFVLKATHSCGDVLLVKDKKKLDLS